ncbi:MAG: hypothetical protein HZA49_03630 [Planctomycetes bacterium]|nr:hypothetical protein [Planctomycetota bacterium]
MSDTLKPLSVKTEHLATKSVTSEKIAEKAIENRHIKEGTVTPDKMTFTPVSRPISPPIDSAEIKDGAIKTDELAGNAVTADKIAPNAITAEKILNGAVTSEKIRDGAITKEKMADGIIGTAEIIDGSITSAKLAGNSVTAAKIASNAVGSSEIQNGAVTPAKLSFSVPSRPLTPPVTTAEIGDGQVTQAKLAPGVGGGDTLTMFPTPQTALDQGGIIATTVPASVDLSAIIPVGTKGVIVSIACITQGYTDGGMMAYIFRQLGAEYALQVGAPAINAPGISNGGSVLMPVAADRTLLWQAYVAGNNSTELVIYILGYIM